LRAGTFLERNAWTEPLTIQAQGSFAVGGAVIQGPDGATLHGDHAYVSYQIPIAARQFPIVMLHGNNQSSKTWETTPDGREGFQNIFLRCGFGVFLVDQPRRGRAGLSLEAGTITAVPNDQMWFDLFRLGIWPKYFPKVQFSRDPESLNQYFRQVTPNTAPFNIDVNSAAMGLLHDKIGPSLLVTHSQGGGVGWFTAMRTDEIRGIVSYEPGSNFPFPEGEAPEALASSGGSLEPVVVTREDFLKLTRFPIIIYYGDYIPETPCDNPGQDQWRIRLVMARKWAETINRYGGDAVIVHLPEVGVHGNTHFPFSDLNNLEIADQMSAFLRDKGLD
jgi:pimeloyl-ACP methyl ester carboxylesterase